MIATMRCCLLIVILCFFFTPFNSYAVQSIGAGTTPVDPLDGELDGIAFSSAGFNGIATLTNGQPLNSTGAPNAAMSTLAGGGTIIFAGDSAVLGDVGIAGYRQIGAINLEGGGTVSFSAAAAGDTGVSVNSLVFGTTGSSDGTVVMGDGMDLSAVVTTFADGTGTLTFAGNSTMTGQIGTDSALLKQINAGETMTTSTLNSDIFTQNINYINDGEIVLSDNVDVNVGADGGTITTGTAGFGTLSLAGNNVINASVGDFLTRLGTVNGGATFRSCTLDGDVYADELNISGQGEVLLNGDFTGSEVVFDDDGTLTVGNGVSMYLESGITTAEAGYGTLRFLGDGYVNNTIGSGGEVGLALKAIYAGAGDGETNSSTTLTSTVYAGTVFLTGQGTVEFQADLYGGVEFQDDGLLYMTGDDVVLQGILATTTNGKGRFYSEGSVSVTGDIGSEGLALNTIGASDAMYLNAINVYVNQITTSGQGSYLEFSPLEDSMTIRTNIMEAEDGGQWMDTVTFYGNVDFIGDIGTAELPFSELQFYGSGMESAVVDMTGNIEAYYLWFYGNNGTTLNLTDTNINYAWMGSEMADVVVNFAGTNTFDGYIGDGSVSLEVNFTGGSTTFTSVENGGPFWGEAAAWNIGSGAALNLPQGGEFLGDVTIAANGTLDVKDQSVTMRDGYTQAAGSILKLTVRNIDSFGSLTVDGTATLDAAGKIVLDMAGDAAVTAGNTFQVITVAGGDLSAVPLIEDDSDGWDFTAALNDLGAGAWGILLTAAIVESEEAPSFADQATNGAAEGAGSALDEIRDAGASGDMQNVLNTLDGLSSDQVGDALDSMLPDTSGFNVQGSTQMMDSFVGTQMGHLGDMARAASSGETGMSAGDQPARYTAWVRAFGNAAHQDPRGTSHGYNLSNGGAVLGVETLVSDRFRIGIAVGDAQSYVRSKDNAGRTHINAAQVALYGGYLAESPLYINYALSYASNDFKATREIHVGPADHRVARGDFRGDLYGGMAEAGYGLTMGTAIFTPSAGLSYSHLHLPKYTETGAGDLSLNVGAQDYDRVRVTLGGKFEMPRKASFGTVTPEIHAKYLYDVIAEKQQVLSSFTGGGTAFSTEGFKPARSGMAVGTGLTFATKKNMTVSFQYDLELREDYYAHTGFLNVALAF